MPLFFAVVILLNLWTVITIRCSLLTSFHITSLSLLFCTLKIMCNFIFRIMYIAYKGPYPFLAYFMFVIKLDAKLWLFHPYYFFQPYISICWWLRAECLNRWLNNCWFLVCVCVILTPAEHSNTFYRGLFEMLSLRDSSHCVF